MPSNVRHHRSLGECEERLGERWHTEYRIDVVTDDASHGHFRIPRFIGPLDERQSAGGLDRHESADAVRTGPDKTTPTTRGP